LEISQYTPRDMLRDASPSLIPPTLPINVKVFLLMDSFQRKPKEQLLQSLEKRELV